MDLRSRIVFDTIHLVVPYERAWFFFFSFFFTRMASKGEQFLFCQDLVKKKRREIKIRNNNERVARGVFFSSNGVGVDPVEKVGDASVNARKTGLGAFVSERDDANLRPATVLIQHQRTARIALFVDKLVVTSTNVIYILNHSYVARALASGGVDANDVV